MEDCWGGEKRRNRQEGRMGVQGFIGEGRKKRRRGREVMKRRKGRRKGAWDLGDEFRWGENKEEEGNKETARSEERGMEEIEEGEIIGKGREREEEEREREAEGKRKRN